MPKASFTFYALQSLERAGHVSGIKEFGKLDWQTDITQRLLEAQHASGFWKGNTPTESELVATSFALMCLTGQPEPPRERQLRINLRDKDKSIHISTQRIDDSVPPRQRTVITGGVRMEFSEPDGSKWQIEADRAVIESSMTEFIGFDLRRPMIGLIRLECTGSVNVEGSLGEGLMRFTAERLMLDLTKGSLKFEFQAGDVHSLPPK